MQTKLHLAVLAALATSAVPALASTPVWPDLIVYLQGSGYAYLVDPATDTVVADLETCKGGTLGTTTPDGKKVYVSCAAEGQTEVVVLDLGSKAVPKRITTGIGHAYNASDGRYTMIINYGNNVVAIVDRETLKPVNDL